MDDILNNNFTWYFKGKPYKIFSTTKIKIGDEWVDGIIYETLYDNPEGTHWVRTREDFLSRFKQM